MYQYGRTILYVVHTSNLYELIGLQRFTIMLQVSMWYHTLNYMFWWLHIGFVIHDLHYKHFCINYYSYMQLVCTVMLNYCRTRIILANNPMTIQTYTRTVCWCPYVTLHKIWEMETEQKYVISQQEHNMTALSTPVLQLYIFFARVQNKCNMYVSIHITIYSRAELSLQVIHGLKYIWFEGEFKLMEYLMLET
jgi:hypothetical protein